MDLKEQYFGTEIEMTGITREEAANAVGELFGTQPYYIGTYYSILMDIIKGWDGYEL